MSARPGAPGPFEARGAGDGWLVARPEHHDALRRAGLDSVAGWERRLDRAEQGGTGRAATVRVELAAGPGLRIKRMRRGGWAGGLWRDRFAGSRRLLDNLALPLEARARGIPTPEPVALLLVEGPRGLFRGWLATVDEPDARSLAERLASATPPSASELRAVAAMVRAMHDRGLEHRDLNLGNLLLRPRPGATGEPIVIDLDRGRLRAGSLPFAPRQRALARLERSSVKLLGRQCRVSGVDLRRLWYEAYSAGEAALARSLERARRRNRWRIALHGLGWRFSR